MRMLGAEVSSDDLGHSIDSTSLCHCFLFTDLTCSIHSTDWQYHEYSVRQGRQLKI
jgi:hypothetical protein